MKDWRTLAAEDGPVGRYLLTLDRRRKESMNRDLVRLLLEGGKGMSLRSEVVEAMAAERLAISLRLPILAVIDEWEEVEVRPSTCDVLTWFPENSDQYVSTDSSCFTILRRKPEPDVTELARRAVEARCKWGLTSLEMSNTMDALAEAVDK